MSMLFPERLRKLRQQKKLRQKDVADKLGITVSAYGYYEQGKREASYETLKKLADYFDVNIDYLIGRTDDPIPKNPKTMKEFLEQPTFYWDEGIPAHPDGVKMFKELLEMAKAKAREELRKQREAEEKEKGQMVAEEHQKYKNG